MIRDYGEHTPRVAADCFVADTASVVGDVELASQVSVWYGAVLRADVGRIVVGERTNIQDTACIHMTQDVSDALIGSDVIIAHHAVVHGAIVADRALIGMGAIVMDNAQIGEGAWIAAGSVVPPNKVIPPNSLAVGNPAKVMRPVRDKEHEWAAGAVERYMQLAAEHARQQRR